MNDPSPRSFDKLRTTPLPHAGEGPGVRETQPHLCFLDTRKGIQFNGEDLNPPRYRPPARFESLTAP